MHTLLTAAILVTLNGQPVHDAELCGFKARALQNPFQQYLASNEVVCGKPFPDGVWNVYARRGTELVSARTILVDTSRQSPDAELRLEPAALVTFTNTAPGAFGVVYVTDTVSAFPAGSDGVAIVPANRDVLPLLARQAAPVAVGEMFRADPGSTKSVALDETARAVAAWVSISAADAAALRTARRKQPPLITIARATAANPLRGTMVVDRAMQFFREVPKGNLTIELSGAPWKRQTAAVVIPLAGIAVVQSPLMLIPTSTAIIKWASRRNLDDLVAASGAPCRPLKQAPAKPVLSLLSCRGVHTERSLAILDRDQCRVVGAHEWPAQQGSGDIAFENLEPGGYVAEFSFGDLPPVRASLRLARFEEQTVALDIDYTTLYGRVTAAGQPLSSPAELRFGFVVDAYSDSDGNYTVVLPKQVTSGSVVAVRTCDGKVRGEQIADHDVLPNSRYDIDLPANTITVEAIDESSGAPVPRALVRCGAFRNDEMSSVYYFMLADAGDDARTILSRTGDDGRYVIRSLPPEKALRVCLEHEDYERTCTDPLTLTSTEEKTLRIAMRPKGSAGRIAGITDLAAGTLYWFASDGRESERAAVKADGSFRFNGRHERGETVVLVSANHPLFAFAQPPVAPAETMVITQPAAPSRTFSISIGDENPQQDAIVTIAIGDIVVPYPPLAQHLALHGSQLELRNGGPLLVPDILETAPISAILGPPPDTVPAAMRFLDLFRLPQFRTLPRKPVPVDGHVAFNGPKATSSRSVPARALRLLPSPPARTSAGCMPGCRSPLHR